MCRTIERVLAYQSERVVARICHQLQESRTALTSESLDNRRRSCADELRRDYPRAGACCPGSDALSLEYDGAHASCSRMQSY